MAIDDRFVVDLADVLAIQLECKKCRATAGYPPANWKPHAFQCPNCAEQWFGERTIELQAVEQFANSFKTLLKDAEACHFRVRLEIEHPD